LQRADGRARSDLREHGARGWQEIEIDYMERKSGRSGGKPPKIREILKERKRRTGW
jgi:hypothetical protein